MEGTLTQYQPQTGLTRLPDVMNRLFNESFVLPSLFGETWSGGAARPTLPVSLYETPDAYIMQAALPGLQPENVDINVTGREVAIKGQFQSWTPENGRVIWQGIPTGQFYETYKLPVDLQSDKVEATFEHGILSITLPKAEHLRPRSVKVEVKQ